MHCKNHEPSPHLYYWVCFVFISLSSLKQIQDKTALHLQCCQVCWHMAYVDIKSWRKRTCLAHPQVYSLPSCHSLPWQPPKHHTCRSFLNPFTKNQMHWMHWTRTYRMYMDVYIYIQCILAMRHLVARVPLSSCYGINRTRSTMTGSNKQHDDFRFWSNLIVWNFVNSLALRYFNLRAWNVCWFWHLP